MIRSAPGNRQPHAVSEFVQLFAAKLLFHRLTPRRLAVIGLASVLAGAGVSLPWLSAGQAIVAGLSTAVAVLLGLFLIRSGQRARLARRARALTHTASSPSFLTVDQWLAPVVLTPEVRERLQADRSMKQPILLGRIDNDGRILSEIGELPGFESVDRETFVERYRYGLDLVAIDGAVLIRKDYRGDRGAFLREWLSLATLGETSFSPAIHHVDERRLLLFKSFVPGTTLRQRLVESGARILSFQTESDPELAGLSTIDRLEAVWARGREHFGVTFGRDLLDRLDRRLEAIHDRGVTGFSLSFGNVVLEETSDRPWFIDFDAARVHLRRQTPSFLHNQARDRELFRRIYAAPPLDTGAERERMAAEVCTDRQ